MKIVHSSTSIGLFRAALLFAFFGMTILGCNKPDALPETDDDSDTELPSGNNGTSIDTLTHTSGTPEGSTLNAADSEDLPANSTFSKVVSVTFGTTVSISNPYAESGVTVEQAGQKITINSTIKEVEYILSGTTNSGAVSIYSDNKFKLTLNGVNITNPNGPALNIQSKKRAFVILANGTSNQLTDGSTYQNIPTGEDAKATFFSEGQLIFSGEGALTVKGNYKHAICSDDYIRLISGNINITGALSDGIHTNDAFIADGGSITMTNVKSDGIEAEEGFIVINNGIFNITCDDDGIAASYEEGDAAIDPYVVINGGTFNIKTTEGEGIESKSSLTINKGKLTINTKDDALNAGKSIVINGGDIYCVSTGNDAIDSNGTITVTGGTVVAIGANSPEGSFDCDGNTFKITGGFLLGMGGTTSSPTAGVSTVYALIAGAGTANQITHIEDASGKQIATFLNPKAYATLVLATPKLLASTTYNIYTGGSVTNAKENNGVYTSGTYNKGTKGSSFTTTSKVTRIGGNVMNR